MESRAVGGVVENHDLPRCGGSLQPGLKPLGLRGNAAGSIGFSWIAIDNKKMDWPLDKIIISFVAR